MNECKSINLSGKSAVFGHLSKATVKSAGKFNPIDLPLFDISIIRSTFGEKITNGNYGTIYKVNDCFPSRVYKAIPLENFENGNEITISKTAGELGVAPTFYGAFLAEQQAKTFVVIEMDDAGLSLGKLMEDFAKDTEINANVVAEETPLTNEEKAFQDMIKKIKARYNDNFIVTDTPVKTRLSIEETIDKIYPNRESFYYSLFHKIKVLAENNISYGDSHVGNIMPNYGTEKGLQLIDFDSAEIEGNIQTAVIKTMGSAYINIHFNNFKELPGLSQNSIELIKWFENQ